MKKIICRWLKYLSLFIASCILTGAMFSILSFLLNIVSHNRRDFIDFVYDSLSIVSWYGSGILLGIVLSLFWNSKFLLLLTIFSLFVIFSISVIYFDNVKNWVPLFQWLGYEDFFPDRLCK